MVLLNTVSEQRLAIFHTNAMEKLFIQIDISAILFNHVWLHLLNSTTMNKELFVCHYKNKTDLMKYTPDIYLLGDIKQTN